jgi:putative transcriptional regulator
MSKRAFEQIANGLHEAVQIAKGEATTEFVRHLPETIDVKAIRARTGLSQADFAARYGFSLGRLRDWEQNRSPVDAPSRVLLTIIDREPEAVERALSAA